MRENTEKARERMISENASLVLCCDDDVIVKFGKGISSLIEVIESGADVSSWSAADQIVGKAAAMLYAYANVGEVYAATISKAGLRALETRNIPVFYDILTDKIINRDGSDICPMEKTVKEIEDPEEAFVALKEKVMRIWRNWQTRQI